MWAELWAKWGIVESGFGAGAEWGVGGRTSSIRLCALSLFSPVTYFSLCISGKLFLILHEVALIALLSLTALSRMNHIFPYHSVPCFYLARHMGYILFTFHSHCSAESWHAKNEPWVSCNQFLFLFSPGCPQQDSDIAFLIDGSGSINPTDFQRMKNFVSTVMSQFQKSKTLVRVSG